ncbi:hypothetical protein D7Z26_04725 [Cohnella endophytica]|uniref:Uncharacterized protein n=1 Tax=Cohnella endophytica TaxID=2419778 RepID=A0A494Y3H7_9BACL|nr:hypothetical protein [Cohnella endophytica]RKP57287.1 hypothetical protein D7Z26_04725 [Cohnella endophytica]
MEFASKRWFAILIFSALTLCIAGCGDLNELWEGNPSSASGAPPSDQAVIALRTEADLPAEVPRDIRILEGAKALSAIKTGDGVTKGNGYYQLSYRVSASLQDAAARYRQILKDDKFDFVDEPVAESVSISGSTPAWMFYLTISKSSEVKGETAITISYTK